VYTLPPRLVRESVARGSAAVLPAGGWWRRRARRGVRHSSSVSQQRGESEATAQCPDQRPHEARCTFSSGRRALCMPVRHAQSQAGGRRDAAGGGALPLACPASSCAAHTGPSNACRRHNGRRWRRSRGPHGRSVADEVPPGPPDACCCAAGGLGAAGSDAPRGPSFPRKKSLSRTTY
jgi:hypothetical protein